MTSSALAFTLGLALSQGVPACSNRADATTHDRAFTPMAAAALPPAPPGEAGVALDISALVEQVRPTVVSIAATRGAEEREDPQRVRAGGTSRSIERSLGSGFIVSPDGLVVTNAHVVHGAERVRVQLADGREHEASVLGEDEKLDVALLALRGASGLPVAQFGTSEALRVGDYLVAIGSPFGLRHTVTLGIVSAKERVLGLGPFDHLIQTDASINPGSSGGPVFDGRGRVVGVSTVIHARGQGIGFAIPIDDVRAVIPELRDEGHVSRGVLGVAFQAISYDLARALSLPGPTGALVTDVEPGGPAEKVGIEPGDVILSADDEAIDQAAELARMLGHRKPGESMRLVVRHGKDERVKRVVLAKPDSDDKPTQKPEDVGPRKTIGVSVSDALGGGARIDGLDPRGAAAGELEVGDVVVEVNGQRIEHGADFLRVVDKAKRPGTLLVRVRRDGEALYAAVRVE
ncbi:trypsin-like peptidase domain-containing protein [Polyangium sp. y55x31]|uniref:trypsin-like peptidase domain-containing protein n=1 Tax=Polyangium sp. y55x31 TaxID=3042688 RepID=UPI002482A8B6|nr:trypsin-like peptidase domain-containing protein [Polyangium sp. y55x31]MDI1481504.1 trypsin-like peptidase domain-containing protein [Polyangium sp. y55x31]